MLSFQKVWKALPGGAQDLFASHSLEATAAVHQQFFAAFLWRGGSCENSVTKCLAHSAESKGASDAARPIGWQSLAYIANRFAARVDRRRIDGRLSAPGEDREQDQQGEKAHE